MTCEIEVALTADRQRELTDYTEKVRTIDARIGSFRILFARAAGSKAAR